MPIDRVSGFSTLAGRPRTGPADDALELERHGQPHREQHGENAPAVAQSFASLCKWSRRLGSHRAGVNCHMATLASVIGSPKFMSRPDSQINAACRAGGND
jgi:hypothetical protein